MRGGLKCEVRSVIGEAPVLDFVGSDETLDRYNEVIKQDGWQLENFRANPVIPDCHDYSSIGKILGRATSVSVTEGKLMNRVEFCLDNPMGNIAYKMAKGGFIKSQSVGFIPKEWTRGVGKDQPDVTYLKCELLEISLVVVPANPGATIGMALKSGAIDRSDISALQDFLMQCGKGTPRVRLERFKAGMKVKLSPESPRLSEYPFCEIGTEAVGEVVSTYTREGLMDVEFLGENFKGMLRGVSFAEFVPAEFTATPGRQAGASATGSHDARVEQWQGLIGGFLRK